MVFDTDEQRQEWLPAMLCGRPACAGFPALWCQKDTTWLSFGKPEQKMDLRAVPTTSAHYNDAYILADGRVGKDGQGLQIVFSALDAGYLASLRSPLAWPRRPLMPRASGFRQDDHRPSGIQRWLTSTAGPSRSGTRSGCPARESHIAPGAGTAAARWRHRGCRVVRGSRVKRRAVRAQRRSSTAFTSEVNTSVWKNCW